MDTLKALMLRAEVFNVGTRSTATDLQCGLQTGSRSAHAGAASGWRELGHTSRKLEIRDDTLRAWAKQVDERSGAAPKDVFLGQGRLPSYEDEVRRLQREVTRLSQENEFLKRAAAYFPKECR